MVNKLFLRIKKRLPRLPKSAWVFLGLIILVAAITFGAKHAYTASGDLDHGDCQIEYGQTIASWEGKDNQTWNQQGWYYEAKIFSISADAQAGFFTNFKETPPSTLVGSSDDPQLPSCLEGFDGLINTAESSYKWQGAKPQGVRLGIPDLGDVNNQGRANITAKKLNPNKSLIPPLAAKSFGRAAAWVDDAASVQIETAVRDQTHSLWCQDNARNENCEIAPAQLGDVRGEGYLFTDDNCPENLDCNQSTSWYKSISNQPDEELTELVGRDARGELKPFYLHQQASSSYGYRIGAFTVLTFRYPIATELISNVSVEPAKADPGGSYTFTLSVNKIGPDLSSLNINTDLTDLPLSQVAGFEVNDEAIATINQHNTTQLKGSFKLTGGERGKCYNATINISASNVRNFALSVPPLSGRFCISAPFAAVYTYDVTTRGAVSSDFNQFKVQAAETFANAAGWAKAGVAFREVAASGDFTLVLSAPDQMTSFSSGCDATYSCQVGRYVIINDERWRTATPSWNNSGGSLRDYRHMVVNHEVGHWLGFGHYSCPAAGSAAPVMQQQSINLQGCTHNAWPTPPEIAALRSRL